MGGGEPVRPLSEAEPHLRGRPALERGGTSPEGATGPRARRNLTRGGVQPPSPRARREFASAVSCPSSEAEFRPRVAGPTVWWAAGTTKAVGLAVGS
jgi:hypothetical protein